jgi:hypothetical protein
MINNFLWRSSVSSNQTGLAHVLIDQTISQSEFDLFDFKVNFQDSNQKICACVQFDTRQYQLKLSFEEPYLFDRELAFGIDDFGDKTKYHESDDNHGGRSNDEAVIGLKAYFEKIFLSNGYGA